MSWDTILNPLTVPQSWTGDLSPAGANTRTANTVYQNTTSAPLFVYFEGTLTPGTNGGALTLDVGSQNVAGDLTGSPDFMSFGDEPSGANGARLIRRWGWVPPNSYYKLRSAGGTGGSFALSKWKEGQ